MLETRTAPALEAPEPDPDTITDGRDAAAGSVRDTARPSTSDDLVARWLRHTDRTARKAAWARRDADRATVRYLLSGVA